MAANAQQAQAEPACIEFPNVKILRNIISIIKENAAEIQFMVTPTSFGMNMVTGGGSNVVILNIPIERLAGSVVNRRVNWGMTVKNLGMVLKSADPADRIVISEEVDKLRLKFVKKDGNMRSSFRISKMNLVISSVSESDMPRYTMCGTFPPGDLVAMCSTFTALKYEIVRVVMTSDCLMFYGDNKTVDGMMYSFPCKGMDGNPMPINMGNRSSIEAPFMLPKLFRMALGHSISKAMEIGMVEEEGTISIRIAYILEDNMGTLTFWLGQDMRDADPMADQNASRQTPMVHSGGVDDEG